MITPLFECQQDEKTVTVLVRAPHSRPRDIDISVIDKELHFHCNPYLLHLRFPHELTLDPEENPASYDIGTGIATIPLLKSVPCQYFQRLDMLSTLLVSRKKPDFATPHQLPPGPTIEVLSSEDAFPINSDKSTTEAKGNSDTGRLRLEEHNPLLPAMRTDSVLLVDAAQSFRENVADVAGVEVALGQLSVGRPRYGFGGRYEGIFQARAEDLTEIVELPEPDATPVWRRPQLRHEFEDRKFDPDHYVADFMLSDEFTHVLQFSPQFNLEGKSLSNAAKDALLKLPKRQYLTDIDDHVSSDLAGLLYAYCYDLRTTCGEQNVESAWTISRLCASFSFLEAMRTPYYAVFAAYRRSLAYPLYRNVELAELVLQDTKRLVSCSDVDKLRSRLLRVLLSLRDTFEEEKLLRIFSDIFLTDLCVWIQCIGNNVLQKLSEDVLAVVIDKFNLGWDLVGLERAALNVEMGMPAFEEAATEHLTEQHLSRNDVVNPVPEIVIRSAQRPGFEMTPVGPSSSSTSSSESSSSSSSGDESSGRELSGSNSTPLPPRNIGILPDVGRSNDDPA